jgi:hypothetical protein
VLTALHGPFHLWKDKTLTKEYQPVEFGTSTCHLVQRPNLCTLLDSGNEYVNIQRMVPWANQDLPLTDPAFGFSTEAEYLSMNEECIAIDMLRHLEIFPSATEEDVDSAMRLISAQLQRRNLDGFRKEAEMQIRRETLLETGTHRFKSFMQDGGLDTLQEAVDMLRGALAIFPQGHPNHAISLNNLAGALLKQYEQNGDVSKLAETIDLHRGALLRRPRGHPNRATSLINLTGALLTQYEQDGDISKLAETIGLLREALSLRPRSHPDRADSLNNLAVALRTQ